MHRKYVLIHLADTTVERGVFLHAEQLTATEFILEALYGLHCVLIGLEFLEAYRTEEMIAIDPGISISPECAAHHQVLKKGKAGEVGIGFGKYAGAGMAFGLLPAGGCLVVEVDGKGADRLREDSHTGPDCGDGKGAFRGDDWLFRSVGHGVGEKHLVHSLLELL